MKVFIGSSTAALPMVELVAAWLEEAGVDALPWNRAFPPTHYTLQSLECVAREVRGGVFIFAEDDKLEGKDMHVVRGNVLLEMGMLLRLGRSRVVICRHGNPSSPSDLDGITYINLNKPEQARSALKGWARSLWTRLPTDPPDSVPVLSSFPLEEFRARLEQARTLRILQTFIPGAGHLDRFRTDLRKALDRGCAVKILLCDPRSPICRIREESLDPGIAVKAAVERTFYELGKVLSNVTESMRAGLTVRAYSTLPSSAIYQVDDYFISAPYLHRRLAIDSPQLVASADSEFGRGLESEFEAVWEHPETTVVHIEGVEGWLKQ